MQIVQVTHQRRVRVIQTGKLGACTARQSDELIRRRLGNRHTGDACHFGGRCSASATNEITGRSTPGRRSGHTAVSIWMVGRKAPSPVAAGSYGSR